MYLAFKKKLSLPAQASVLIGLTYSSLLLYICSFCIHKISHTGLAVKVGTFFISKEGMGCPKVTTIYLETFWP
jgi:hypothetical protein